jgi:hypothetical protein
MENFLDHSLFDDKDIKPTELTLEGYTDLINCYDSGKKRIEAIYRQEVLKVEERNTVGRRALGIKKTTLKDYSNRKKKVAQQKKKKQST